MTSIPRSVRRALLAGGAALVLGGAAVGISAAQTAPTPSSGQQAQTNYQKFIDALAAKLGIQPADLQTKISQARTEVGLPAGNGFPRGERGGPGRGGMDLSAAATALSLSPQQLRTELNGKSLAEVASAHNVPLATLTAALKKAQTDRIDAAVTAGRLTADQANQHKAQLDARITQLVDQVHQQGGQGGPGRPGFGGRGFGGRGGELATAATALSLSPQQLMTELNGKSLAEVASAHNVPLATLTAALKKAQTDRIDAAVTANRLTADQANQQKAQLDARITQLVNQVHQQRLPGAEAEAEDAAG